MQVTWTEKDPTALEGDALVLFLFEGDEALHPPADRVDQAMGGAVSRLKAYGDLEGKVGDTAVLYPGEALPVRRVVLAGVGRREDFTPEHGRRAAGTAARRCRDLGVERIAFVPVPELPLDLSLHAAVEGMLMALYRTGTRKSDPPEKKPVREVTALLPGGADREAALRGIERGQIFADAACTARDLVNVPANQLTPTNLADTAQALAVEEGLACEILDRDAVEELGMEGLLAVARGSVQEPRFIVVEYDPWKGGTPPSTAGPCVLVGKGVTFDSGGISLKSKEGMERMKSDMAGAAAVLAALQGAARLRLPLRAAGLIPACENLPSGSALKPGDVVRLMNGKTVEVANTDAEGRLILADALCYAARYKPSVVVDVATLTGACVVALGEEVAAGLFTTEDDLAREIMEAGTFNGERFWRLPLFDAYRRKIESDQADLKNSGGRYGGVGTSAVFLQAFVAYPWAHLDIAGMAFFKTDQPFAPKGATGFGTRTLLSFLQARAGRTGEREEGVGTERADQAESPAT